MRREAINIIRGCGTIVAMLLLLLLSMLIGWLIGGPDCDSRRVLATSTGMRSVIVVLFVLRRLYWAKSGDVRVNGRTVPAFADPGSYLVLRGPWKNGDRIEPNLPMHLHDRTV